MQKFLKLNIFIAMIGAILVLAGVFPISIVAQPTWKESSLTSSGPTILIEVRDAYYDDLDGDGLEDDVHTYVHLDLIGANRYNFDYYLTLTLPSGMEFMFGWMINTRLPSVNLNSTLLNTALEPGWYHLHVEVVLKTGGIGYLDEEHIFDPPGEGDPGGDPTGGTHAWY